MQVDPTDEFPPLLSVQELRRQLSRLQTRLAGFVERDPHHMVDGVALPLVDTLIAAATVHFERHPIIDRLASGTAPVAAQREPIRAADLLIAVDLLLHSLPGGTE